MFWSWFWYWDDEPEDNIFHSSTKLFTSGIKWQGCCIDHEIPCSVKANKRGKECINITMRHVHITVVSVEMQ